MGNTNCLSRGSSGTFQFASMLSVTRLLNGEALPNISVPCGYAPSVGRAPFRRNLNCHPEVTSGVPSGASPSQGELHAPPDGSCIFMHPNQSFGSGIKYVNGRKQGWEGLWL